MLDTLALALLLVPLASEFLLDLLDVVLLPVVQDLLARSPDEIRQTQLLLLEKLYLPQDLVLLRSHAVVHHYCAVEVVRVLLLDFDL